MTRFIGTAQTPTDILLFYLQNEREHSFLKVKASQNGIDFSEKSQHIFAFDARQGEEQNYAWEKVNISKEDDKYALTYKVKDKKNSPLFTAVSPDLMVWHKIGQIKTIHETGVIVPEYQHKNSYVMYTGEKNISLAYSHDLIKWTIKPAPVITPREGFFDDSDLEVTNAHLVNDSILLLYYVKKEVNSKIEYSIGAAYFDRDNPAKLLWRSDEPLLELPEDMYRERIQPAGSTLINDKLIFYWLLQDSSLFAISCPIPDSKAISKKHIYAHIVKKAKNNPIITPRPSVPWESRATFNSAALYEDGKVHFLYRALGDTDLSVLGYATSRDGVTIDYRSSEPAYIPREPFETPGNLKFSSIAQHFMSGGGYGGIEDPRITRVEDKVYLTYVAFDGANPPRVAISSIHIKDFLNNNWDKWEKAKLISAPNMIDKSAVVMPRKIRGKYVVMHRIYPNILVDYLDDLEFNNYLEGQYFIPPRKRFWDSKKVGAGAPPIETKDGWLMIYQSVGYQDPSRYKVGAMMLDRDNPEKVLYRTHAPIISPDERYENEGYKSGVVYPCGAVIMNKNLNIYYGGADSVVCAAKADIDTFLDTMKRHREPKLQRVNSQVL